MNKIDRKTVLKSLLRNKFYSTFSILGIAFTFAFIYILLIYVRNTTGNVAPGVNKDRTILLDEYLQSNEGWVEITLDVASYYHQLTDANEVATLNFQAPFIEKSGKVYRVPIGYISSNFFSIFSFDFIEGRTFTLQEEENREPVIVMSNSFARQYFNDEHAVGKQIAIQGRMYRIVGVFKKPNFFSGFSEYNCFIPRTLNNFLPQGGVEQSVYIMGSSKQSVKKISDELSRLHTTLYREGIFKKEAKQHVFQSMQQEAAASHYATFSLMLALLLLVPAVNLLSLNSSKMAEQAEEVSVRRAYGASHKAIFSLLFNESLLVSFIGGVLGIALAGIFLLAVNSCISSQIDATATLGISFDGYSLGGLFILILVFNLLSCAIPAWQLSRKRIAENIKGGEL